MGVEFTVFSSVACYAACHAFPAHRLQPEENPNGEMGERKRHESNLGPAAWCLWGLFSSFLCFRTPGLPPRIGARNVQPHHHRWHEECVDASGSVRREKSGQALLHRRGTLPECRAFAPNIQRAEDQTPGTRQSMT